jgi:hypothetical protein
MGEVSGNVRLYGVGSEDMALRWRSGYLAGPISIVVSKENLTARVADDLVMSIRDQETSSTSGCH